MQRQLTRIMGLPMPNKSNYVRFLALYVPIGISATLFRLGLCSGMVEVGTEGGGEVGSV